MPFLISIYNQYPKAFLNYFICHFLIDQRSILPQYANSKLKIQIKKNILLLHKRFITITKTFYHMIALFG